MKSTSSSRMVVSLVSGHVGAPAFATTAGVEAAPVTFVIRKSGHLPFHQPVGWAGDEGAVDSGSRRWVHLATQRERRWP